MQENIFRTAKIYIILNTLKLKIKVNILSRSLEYKTLIDILKK